MSAELQKSLALCGREVTALEAERCHAARDAFNPLDVCLKWKAAEESLMKNAPRAAMEDIFESNLFDIGTAHVDNSPCLVIHAKQQNPGSDACSASLLSTLWACDAAMASKEGEDVKLTVGYDFEEAGVHNFSLDTALAFSRLFANEYPCLVKDIYLIKMPWLLKQVLPLFKPLVSHRLRLIPVERMDDFVNLVNYQVTAGQSVSRGPSLSNHIEKEVPRAAAWMRGAWKQQQEQEEHDVDMSLIAQVSKKAFGSISPWVPGFRSTGKNMSPFVVPIRPHTLMKLLPLDNMLCGKLDLLFRRSIASNQNLFSQNLYNQASGHGFSAMLFNNCANNG